MPKICIDCHQEVEKVNRKGRCWSCAMQRINDSVRDLQEKRGPYYDRWLAARQKREAKRP